MPRGWTLRTMKDVIRRKMPHHFWGCIFACTNAEVVPSSATAFLVAHGIASSSYCWPIRRSVSGYRSFYLRRARSQARRLSTIWAAQRSGMSVLSCWTRYWPGCFCDSSEGSRISQRIPPLLKSRRSRPPNGRGAARLTISVRSTLEAGRRDIVFGTDVAHIWGDDRSRQTICAEDRASDCQGGLDLPRRAPSGDEWAVALHSRPDQTGRRSRHREERRCPRR